MTARQSNAKTSREESPRGSSMLLSAADRLGLRNVRTWHTACALASGVVAAAADRESYSAGVGMICDAVQEFMDAQDCDEDANEAANLVARFASTGGCWRPGELCEANRWKTGDKVELLRLLRAATQHGM